MSDPSTIRRFDTRPSDFLEPPGGWIDTRCGAKSGAKDAVLIICAVRRLPDLLRAAASSYIGQRMQVRESLLDAIGNTPLIKLRRASEETGCTILGKAEFMNPGQSVKDRAALGIIRAAMGEGRLRPGGIIVDGTAGNTGIGLAVVGNALGMRTVIVIPETQTREKKDALRMLGATVVEVPAVPYKNPNNYVKVAARLAERLANEHPHGAIFANQFDNVANRDAHVRTTGPEIWGQTGGKVDAFVSAVGTGGTLAGVAIALRERNPDIVIALADVPGAALFNYYTTGELRAEGNSITEGIGQGRITANLEGLAVDESFLIPDEQTVRTVYSLIEDEGLALGASSGVNVAGAVQLARKLGRGNTIVTMLCDPASRYQSRLFNADFLRSKGLPVAPWLEKPAGIRPDFIAADGSTETISAAGRKATSSPGSGPTWSSG